MARQNRSTPSCPSGHGLMVPMDHEFAFVQGDKVTATVMWVDGRKKGRPGIKELIYAPGESVAAQLPRGEKLGDKINALVRAGQLTSFYKIALRLSGLYLVHDHRPGQGRSYMIWTGGKVRGRGPTPLPETVYYCMGSAAKPSNAPRLTDYKDVRALMDTPGAVMIDSLRGVDTSKEWTEVFGTDRVLVANIQKLYKGH